MKELLINFYCPSTSKSYDFWVPKTMAAESVLAQVCEDICALEGREVFTERDALVLCSYLSGKTLPMSSTLEQEGIKSGDRLAVV